MGLTFDQVESRGLVALRAQGLDRLAVLADEVLSQPGELLGLWHALEEATGDGVGREVLHREGIDLAHELGHVHAGVGLGALDDVVDRVQGVRVPAHVGDLAVVAHSGQDLADGLQTDAVVLVAHLATQHQLGQALGDLRSELPHLLD